MSGMAIADDVAMMGGGIDDSYKNPDTFQEAWNLHDETDKEQWRIAIRKEFNNMMERKVWRHKQEPTRSLVTEN